MAMMALPECGDYLIAGQPKPAQCKPKPAFRSGYQAMTGISLGIKSFMEKTRDRGGGSRGEW
jgi:hypothetical protein